jgi:hypothetical protein
VWFSWFNVVTFTALWPTTLYILITLFTLNITTLLCELCFFIEEILFLNMDLTFNDAFFLLKYHFIERLYLRMPGSITRTFCVCLQEFQRSSDHVSWIREGCRDRNCSSMCSMLLFNLLLSFLIFWCAMVVAYNLPFFQVKMKSRTYIYVLGEI